MASSDVTTIALRVEGMHCGSCVALVEETLTEMPGVESAQVDLEAGSAAVTFHTDQIQANELVDIVTDVGYKAALAPKV